MMLYDENERLGWIGLLWMVLWLDRSRRGLRWAFVQLFSLLYRVLLGIINIFVCMSYFPMEQRHNSPFFQVSQGEMACHSPSHAYITVRRFFRFRHLLPCLLAMLVLIMQFVFRHVFSI